MSLTIGKKQLPKEYAVCWTRPVSAAGRPERVDGEQVVKAELLRMRRRREGAIQRAAAHVRRHPSLTDEQVLLRLGPIVHNDSAHVPAYKMVGGEARWLERRSLAGGLSLIYA